MAWVPSRVPLLLNCVVLRNVPHSPTAWGHRTTLQWHLAHLGTSWHHGSLPRRERHSPLSWDACKLGMLKLLAARLFHVSKGYKGRKNPKSIPTSWNSTKLHSALFEAHIFKVSTKLGGTLVEPTAESFGSPRLISYCCKTSCEPKHVMRTFRPQLETRLKLLDDSCVTTSSREICKSNKVSKITWNFLQNICSLWCPRSIRLAEQKDRLPMASPHFFRSGSQPPLATWGQRITRITVIQLCVYIFYMIQSRQETWPKKKRWPSCSMKECASKMPGQVQVEFGDMEISRKCLELFLSSTASGTSQGFQCFHDFQVVRKTPHSKEGRKPEKQTIGWR